MRWHRLSTSVLVLDTTKHLIEALQDGSRGQRLCREADTEETWPTPHGQDHFDDIMSTLRDEALLTNFVSRQSICMTVFALLDCEANAFNRGSALRRALLRLMRDGLVKKVHALFECLCKHMVLSRKKDFDLFLRQLLIGNPDIEHAYKNSDLRSQLSMSFRQTELPRIQGAQVCIHGL